MSKISINIAEKGLLTHIRMGGSVFDPVGKEYLVKFATKALSDSSISEIARRYNISHQDICLIYANMISELMPNPCIDSGGPLLVPTLFFMEPFRFEGLASEISARTAGDSDDERLRKLMELSFAAARQTWNAHTTARGEARFVIQDLGGKKSTGCAGLIIIGATMVSGTMYSIYQVLT